MQVLQNKLERTSYAKHQQIDIKTIKRIPTKELLEANQVLSIHQMGAKAILNTMRKIITSKKPEQLYNKLKKKNSREGEVWSLIGTPRLTISKSNIIEKGVKLWNQITPDMKNTQSTPRFKKDCKEWVKANVPIKPG